MSAWWDDTKELLLLTPKEFDDLPDGTVVKCIDGKFHVKGLPGADGTNHIDRDTRGGLLAYGVVGNHPLLLAEKAKDALLLATSPSLRNDTMADAQRRDEEYRASKWEG